MIPLRRTAGIAFCLVLSGFLPALCKTRHRAAGLPARAARFAVIFVQAPTVASGDLAGRFPQGSRLVRLVSEGRPGSLVNLTSEFFAAADPRISYDGSQLLFSGQKTPGARWQIWEMNVDGSEKRQLTYGAGDCLRPAYLPRDEIVFTAVSRDGPRSVAQLYVSRRDATEARPITFGPGNFQVETVLRDGRILASASWPLVAGSEAANSRDLYTLQPDGSGLASYRCDHQQPAAIRAEAEELDDGSVVFVKTPRASREVGGELAMIRRGALRNSPLSPLRTASWSPRRLDREKLIVARKSVSPKGAEGKFDLYTFDSERGKFGERVFEDHGFSSVQAVPLVAHPTPKWHWSTLNPESKAGYFICLNSYLSADAPKGRFATPIARVRVKTLELTSAQERALGDAPVEQDGSFYLAVPPDRPVRFELLDASGRVVHAQRSWVWARPGEEHGCAGCHENKAVAPENRWPLTLRRFDTPTPLGIQNSVVPAH